MLRTLYGKLALTLVALLSLVGGLFLVANLISTRLFLQEISQGLHRDLASHLVEESLPMEGGTVQQEALEHIFHVLMLINPAIEVYLLDTEGRLLAFSAPEGTVVREVVGLDPVSSFLGGADKLPILGDDPRSLEGQKVFSVATVPSEGELEGYLYVILGGQKYDSAVAMIRGSHILRLGLGASIAGLIFAVASGLLVFAVITRRVRDLASAVETFEESGYVAADFLADSRQATGGDEIDRLARTFGDMGERLACQLDELETTDRLRRELVANVSHDLRTPITSLRGYLETLHVKADTLSDEDRREYLQIALGHSERLAQLVEALFELAKLESCATPPEIESIVLAELVQDAVQQFQLEAERHQVKLEAELPADTVRVSADVGLVARVLDNLLDNALRHTPAGGEVTVRLVEKPEKLQVRVEDTGPGIAPEDLSRVFDRFFHGSTQSDPDREGTGLGLAIARKALELQDSQLQVESEVGHGSIFWFELGVVGS